MYIQVKRKNNDYSFFMVQGDSDEEVSLEYASSCVMFDGIDIKANSKVNLAEVLVLMQDEIRKSA